MYIQNIDLGKRSAVAEKCIRVNFDNFASTSRPRAFDGDAIQIVASEYMTLEQEFSVRRQFNEN